MRVEQTLRGGWAVMLEGSHAPISLHDTEEEARERLASYLRGLAAAEAAEASAAGAAPSAAGERIRLRDGGEVIVRPVSAEDKPLLAEGFERLGPDSRYQRFIAFKKRLTPDELEFLTEVDHVDHEAVGAIDPQTGRGVAIARFLRDPPGSATAEAAVTVVDEWQHRGVGWLLLERLAARAREVGIREFTASVLTGNRAMLALFDRLGRLEVRHDPLSGSTVAVNVSLPTDSGELCEALRDAACGEPE